MSPDHKYFSCRTEDIEKLQDSEGWSYVLEELTANSKKASMLWCGKVPFGGAKGIRTTQLVLHTDYLTNVQVVQKLKIYN